MIKYLMLGIVLMGMAAFAGSQMQQTYAQTSPTMTPTATPTTSMSTPKAPATGRAM